MGIQGPSASKGQGILAPSLDGLGKLSACSPPSSVASPARTGTRYAGRGEVMQREDIALQEPAEEWMDWKSEPPQQKRDKAYPLPPRWVRESLRLLPAIIGG